MRDYPRHRMKLPGPKSFSQSSNATGERFATGLTFRASLGPPRFSNWLVPMASKFLNSTTNQFTCPRLLTPITTERARQRRGASFLFESRIGAAGRVAGRERPRLRVGGCGDVGEATGCGCKV